MAVDEQLLEVLSDIERSEARLLAWGVVDAAMSEEELLDTIEESAARHGIVTPATDVLEDLLQLRLIFEVAEHDQEGFRSRMAEAVRLFARLRQWLVGRTWSASPSLVADFRFDVRPRAYPRREIALDDVLARLGSQASQPVRVSSVRALLSQSAETRERLLANFQVEAAHRILRGLDSERAGGTIVTAGTGGGKTLAFYLPVLAWLADQVADEAATRVIAIYPRNELLKDQLAQCLAEVDRLGDVGRRPIRVGALFGATPHNARDVEGKYRAWRFDSVGGRRAPYVNCPRCGGALLWMDSDRQRSPVVERLRCESRCDYQLGPDRFALTRDAIKASPPDVLFTTTEMLNRLMSDLDFAPALGTRSSGRRPAIVLLDEVHTYGGTSGAQVAHLLRRWHNAAGRRVQFVGLSATLRDATGFFARLTGLREHLVREVTPAQIDLERRGSEYLLAVRGNPMSGSALLSTTIQTLMLAGRILEPAQSLPGSSEIFGSRVFAFTDKLDLANRLFHFLSDAEGWGPYERPSGPALASLRASSSSDGDRPAARAAGQVWDMPEAIGHDLNHGRLGIGITTSQRGGVEERDVIVATAALEVGYNDERVGLVLQHKAPRDPAAFIQRRGRAGRLTSQRPWTIVVLSDFGRDRVAYQSYEQLFDPMLPARSLPTANQSVRRMQAAMATLDWLAWQRRMRQSVWDDLTKPGYRRAQSELAATIENVLSNPDRRSALQRHLTWALDIDDESALALMWEGPRGVLTEVLPTALRRLVSGWTHFASGPGKDLQAATSPLPDFIPPNLFTDLQLPELQVTVPPQNRNAVEETHSLPSLQALTEFAPGNVTFRYAIEGPWAASWIAPGSEEKGLLDLGEFCAEFDENRELDHEGQMRRAIGPWRLMATRRPSDVLDSSRGVLRWAGGPVVQGGGAHVDVPESSPWRNVVARVEAHLHVQHRPVEVRRYAVGFDAEIGRRAGGRTSVSRDFALDGRPASIGFEYDGDAIVFHIRVPEADLESHDAVFLRSFRAAWFARRVETDPHLAATSSIFQREQLERAYVAAIAEEALQQRVDLQRARQSFREDEMSARLASAVEAMFAVADTTLGPAQRLDELRDLAVTAETLAALDRCAEALWAPFDAAARDWAHDRFVATVAATLADAAQRLCNDFDLESEVAVDVRIAEHSRRELWFAERSPGGGGILETLHRRMVERPRQFFALMDRAVRRSDFELVDATLMSVLDDLSRPRSALADCFAAYRGAATNDERVTRLDAIRHALDSLTLPSTHPVMAALAARVIRHGSTASTDVALADLARRWAEAEQALGIELEASALAFAERKRDDYDALVVGGFGNDAESRRYAAMTSALWVRGWRARAEGLRCYSPFSEFAPTDRLALERYRLAASAGVRVDREDWRDLATRQLIEHGTVVLEADGPQPLAAAIRVFVADPVDTGILLLHPTTIGIDRDGTRTRATLVFADGATG